MKHAPLYFIVSISGASVLALEILGTRILGPFYGVSLFLWSALISVTLLALSVGYALGGRLADRNPSYGRLSLVLLAAGLWILAIPWLKGPLLGAADKLGLRTAVLVASFLLFFPPLLLLGMISPYAIRLRASSLDEVGRTAGDLYAVSTIAGVLGAVFTGFLLIPNVGINRLILLIGASLLVSAIVARASTSRRAPSLALLAGVTGGLIALWGASAEGPDVEHGILASRQSPYAEIRVLDRNDERWLLIDGGIHTRALPGIWQSTHRYAVVVDVLKYMFEKPGRMLLVGLGGGSVAKSFASDKWDVDVVEIDPVVTETARRHFGFKERDGRVVHMDGRRFLASSGSKYDAIVFDAFGSSSIPFHLVTEECFRLAASRLETNGVLAMNIETIGWDDPLIGALAATLKKHFTEVLALPTSEPPNSLGNIVLLASLRVLDVTYEQLGVPFDFLPDPYMHWVVVQRNHAWDNRFTPAIDGHPVLTDDLNPVDLWAERINRAARKELHELFREDGLNW